MERDKSHRGNASQFFVAGELCRRGYAAVVTLGNTPNTDVLCSNRAGTRFAHIQVKTFVPGTKSCNVGLKSERQYSEVFFWILAGIPAPKSDLPFEYFVVPCSEMAANVAARHQRWLSEPGRKGQQRKDSSVRAVAVVTGTSEYLWNVEPYRNRWDLIEQVLDG
ncbi:hypothetical protein QTI24_01435 [Variovorax sp. J22P240]|uniref:hypothetical protein n=1 Tax=Variovorax sp. J22P240 TaxID=3053514 RepID=UPI002577593B|nr:hypothetical protein [Variovorax sp. J22P240]MDL9997244.1 hypothetical protein [Variovorax sp. J22P240]